MIVENLKKSLCPDVQLVRISGYSKNLKFRVHYIDIEIWVNNIIQNLKLNDVDVSSELEQKYIELYEYTRNYIISLHTFVTITFNFTFFPNYHSAEFLKLVREKCEEIVDVEINPKIHRAILKLSAFKRMYDKNDFMLLDVSLVEV